MVRGRNRYDDDEPFINENFVDRVDYVIDDTILHDDTWKEWEHYSQNQEEREQRKIHERKMDLSELRRIVENFSKSDFAAVVITAMENYPFMVLQIVAEYIINLENTRKRTDNNE